MKLTSFTLLILLCLTIGCTKTPSNSVTDKVTINASKARVWDIITNPKYAKITGNVFDKNAFIDSDWKLNSKAHFTYEPNNVVATGTISHLTPEKEIVIEYDFTNFEYKEMFHLDTYKNGTLLSIHAGPYTEDFEAQKVVWNKWLNKIKELSEKL
jgi:uncharacterized protein YndB with AHSA1/START domain